MRLIIYFIGQYTVFAPSTMLDGNTTMVDVDESQPNRYLLIKGNSNTTGSYIYKRNFVSTNGVVHLINQVLLP